MKKAVDNQGSGWCQGWAYGLGLWLHLASHLQQWHPEPVSCPECCLYVRCSFLLQAFESLLCNDTCQEACMTGMQEMVTVNAQGMEHCGFLG